MNIINKKSYIYKMNLLPANILCGFVFIFGYILTPFISLESFYKRKINPILVFRGIILYMGFQE